MQFILHVYLKWESTLPKITGAVLPIYINEKFRDEYHKYEQ